jgi:hypothetical protein
VKIITNLGKPTFQIAHQKQEIHTLQTYSVFDKNSWLQEAESARSRYISMCFDLESTYMRSQMARYRKPVVSSQRSTDDAARQSMLGSFFFGSKKNADDNPPLSGRRISKRISVFPSPSSSNTDAIKPSPQDLVGAKNRLSKASKNSADLPTPEQISPIELQRGKKRLSMSPLSNKPGELRKQGSLQNMRSSSNLLDKFKKSFKH